MITCCIKFIRYLTFVFYFAYIISQDLAVLLMQQLFNKYIKNLCSELIKNICNDLFVVRMTVCLVSIILGGKHTE